ncbi:SGNH/GDSL hydrolase family protein [Tenacibaculum agarivorans]|uniref:SGNH/GDSL hydrolase family protein n=1 Tax=Tenacibaculum agarivorans TaxID=1908389 RepID=UPI00094B83AB|nr:SGNH/GDSL hydrolase family protein [Tenacibaculum agarivorans]
MKHYLITLSLFLFSSFTIFSQEKYKKDYTVLFVGNSLTYYNNLPKLITKYAKKHKEIHIKTKTITFPNYAIEDHWNDGKVQKLIVSQKFDFLILQQGPSSQKAGKKMLIDYGKKYAELCEANKIQLCYFMVWPSLMYYHTFEKVIENHTEAAKLNNAILLPVGKHWKEHIEENNDYSYYGPDEFHPSKKGSKKAAQIIVETLFKK